uniref:Uncharacterized protein n=1 Tax=Zea mays TaxID=4577 RepID=C4J0R8_MAIZE|nr:unknown [Zea mays]
MPGRSSGHHCRRMRRRGFQLRCGSLGRGEEGPRAVLAPTCPRQSAVKSAIPVHANTASFSCMRGLRCGWLVAAASIRRLRPSVPGRLPACWLGPMPQGAGSPAAADSETRRVLCAHSQSRGAVSSQTAAASKPQQQPPPPRPPRQPPSPPSRSRARPPSPGETQVTHISSTNTGRRWNNDSMGDRNQRRDASVAARS